MNVSDSIDKRFLGIYFFPTQPAVVFILVISLLTFGSVQAQDPLETPVEQKSIQAEELIVDATQRVHSTLGSDVMVLPIRVGFQDAVGQVYQWISRDEARVVVEFSVAARAEPLNRVCVSYGLNGEVHVEYCRDDGQSWNFYVGNIVWNFPGFWSEVQLEAALTQMAFQFPQKKITTLVPGFYMIQGLSVAEFGRAVEGLRAQGSELGFFFVFDDKRDRRGARVELNQFSLMSLLKFRRLARELAHEGVRLATVSSLPQPFGEGTKLAVLRYRAIVRLAPNTWRMRRELMGHLANQGLKIVEELDEVELMVVEIPDPNLIGVIEKIPGVRSVELTR